MKTKLRALGMFITLSALTANSQTAGGAASGAASSPGINPPPPQNQQAPPQQRDPNGLPPAQLNQDASINTSGTLAASNQFSAGTNQFGIGTNQFGVMSNRFDFGSNQFGFNSNRFGFGSNQFGIGDTNRFVVGISNQFGLSQSNQFGASTNQGGLAPTSTSGSTNRVYSTNDFNGTNQPSIKAHDQATTDADRVLLIQIREQVGPQLRVSGAWAPVGFQVHEGVVTLVGIVPSTEQKQQIEALVQQVHGVVNVVDQLVVGSSEQVDQAGGAALTPEANTPETVVTPEVVEVPAPEGTAITVATPPATTSRTAIESTPSENRPGTWSSATNLPPTGITIERIYETNASLSGLGLQELPPEWKKVPRLLPPALWDPKN